MKHRKGRQSQPAKTRPAEAGGPAHGLRAAERLTPGLTSTEWFSLAFTLLFVHAALLRKIVYAASIGDAVNYQEIAWKIVRNGLFSAGSYSPLRTYGYPLFLSSLAWVEKWTSIPLNILAAEVQCALYLLAAWLLRNEIRRISKRFGRSVLVAMCLNVFVLGYLAETLTEGLTIILILLCASCWFWSVRRFRTHKWLLPAAIGGLVAGFSVMVRPGNMFVPCAWVAGHLVLVFRRPLFISSGELMRRGAVFLLLLCAVGTPCVPQLYSNAIHAKKATPLMADDLPNLQFYLGVYYLKVVWGVPPVPQLVISYHNPVVKWAASHADPNHPLSWYQRNPGPGLLTFCLHVFALLDQDFIFTYVVDLAPPYRVPLSIVNHFLIGLALFALWRWCRPGRSAGRADPVLRASLVAVLVYIAGILAVYGASRVEARYGLPLIVLAAPLAAAGIGMLRGMPRRSLAGVSIAIVCYTVVALLGSEWMRSQSPPIVDWERRPRPAAAVRGAERDGVRRSSPCCPLSCRWQGDPRPVGGPIDQGCGG
jgi:hypothetical protein